VSTSSRRSSRGRGRAAGDDSADANSRVALRRPRLRWRVVAIAMSFVALLILAAGVASVIDVPYYAITPGAGIPVSGLVTVPRRLAHSHLGSVLLTDVEVVPLRALSYIYYELDSNAQVVPAAALVGTASGAQYQAQGSVDMWNAREAAIVVALRQLGYHTRAVPSGVIVYQPEPGSAASRGLGVGDVITSVDSGRVRTLAALVAALGAHGPGSTVELGVRPLTGRAVHRVRVRLGEIRVDGSGPDAPETCAAARTDTQLPPLEVHGVPAACLGIAAEQAYTAVGVPFPVSISADGIDGPSAGLAFTLGLIEKLDHEDLVAGLKVAATGTMSVTGQVGDVGGVAQKTIAVRDAGASLFFVPPSELQTAEAHAGPTLKVLAVASIGQAVADLEELGGRLSPPSTVH